MNTKTMQAPLQDAAETSTPLSDLSTEINQTQTTEAASDCDAGNRDIEEITRELLAHKATYSRSAYEIGKLLLEAKAQLEHGQWLDWLQKRVDFSERTAHRFMQLAKGYPDSTALAKLGYSKSLCLLSLPVVERKAFLSNPHKVNGVEKGVEDMSVRELQKAVRDDKGQNDGESGGGSGAPADSNQKKAKKASDKDFQYVQERIDEMLACIEELIDQPASYNDLTASLRDLCEAILQKLTSELHEVS